MTGSPRPPLDPACVLDAVPTPNVLVRGERRGTTLVLWRPRPRTWWSGLAALLLPWRDQKGFALDALGEEVWSACDGERSFEHIIEAFAERHRLRFHEARVPVAQFVRVLVERDLLSLVTPEGSRASGESSDA